MALFLAKKFIILAKYLDFANISSKKLANIFSEQMRANKHAIKLEKGKQSSYTPIYSPGWVWLKTLKTYIITNQGNSFIRASNLLADALILFIYKLDNSFCLCVDYQGLNNFKIKNWYLFLLIGEFLDWLDQAKQFTQLDLISTYH